MRTMFVSPEQNASKKKFQKPNILRRKPKASLARPSTSDVNESNKIKSPVNFCGKEETYQLYVEKIPKVEFSDSFQVIETPISELTIPHIVSEGNETAKETDFIINTSSNITVFESNAQFDNNENLGQGPLNIDSFLNGAVSKDIHASTLQPKDESLSNETWCLDFVNDPKGIVLKTYDGSVLSNMDRRSELVTIVPSVVVSSMPQHKQTSPNSATAIVAPTQTLTIDSFTSRAVKFKCDEPNCNKGFWSELRLKKHKNSHNKQSRSRPTQITIECPVKKVNEEGGVEERCGRMFLAREELLKHLNEEHTLDDAMYRCEVCGRRFFWATGLRAHGQSHCARGSLACAWPGCGRVFRQPCRLREHARAHTGDRPYPCNYPNCGWSFRSASKLVRHARRHTGERRHECSACGRAFLRPEHLRDHYARYHLPRQRDQRLCTHPGCEQTFTNMSTLYVHMKKVHRKDESGATAAAASAPRPAKNRKENKFVVSLMPETEVQEANVSIDVETPASGGAEEAIEGVVGGVEGGSWRAARTHCTWPLAPRRLAPDAYVLEEDAVIEQSEGSESNIYTIRSDLFLHGNVLINEDSEFIVSRESSGEVSEEGVEGVGVAGAGGGVVHAHTHTLGPDHVSLDLIDAHPTIDLMQEELMYADAAVDESSFRVFLMNGEELA